MNDAEIRSFLDAAGVKYCLAVLVTKKGDTRIIDTTNDSNLTAGLMYRLKKCVDTRLVQEMLDSEKRYDMIAELKKAIDNSEVEAAITGVPERKAELEKQLTELRAALKAVVDGGKAPPSDEKTDNTLNKNL